MAGLTLLKKHNPILVIFPQEFPSSELRARPGSLKPGKDGWGDYNPCTVKFFLDNVEQRYNPKPWLFQLGKKNTPGTKTGMSEIQNRLRKKLEENPGYSTEDWELDVASLPSQNEELAWKKYRKLLSDPDQISESKVYGRAFKNESGKVVLQYWYLYMYNDFWNNHEGDWEMVTIKLGENKQPEKIACSNHTKGIVARWNEIEKDNDETDRPILYVARGSHAGFFGHIEQGYPAFGINWKKEAPSNLGWLTELVERLRNLARSSVDVVPYDPLGKPRPTKDTQYKGVRLDIEVEELPEDYDIESEFWWLLLECKWGSRHTRFRGFTGVDSPWAPQNPFDSRWRNPIEWLEEQRPWSEVKGKL